MAGKIFINYRHGDDPGFIQALVARLERSFSPEQLFIDIDNIEPGLDFTEVLADQVAKCDVVLAVIGKGWVDARDEENNRRLDSPKDFVRIEITSALQQKKRVIPVLVGGAPMPRENELPDALIPLTKRHAVRLTNERFRADTDGLIKALGRALEQAEDLRKAEEEAAAQAQDIPEQQKAEVQGSDEQPLAAAEEHLPATEGTQEQVLNSEEMQVATAGPTVKEPDYAEQMRSQSAQDVEKSEDVAAESPGTTEDRAPQPTAIATAKPIKIAPAKPINWTRVWWIIAVAASLMFVLSLPKIIDAFSLSGRPASADSMYQLGLTYHYGRGVSKDNVQARKWFEKAAAAGNADAKLALQNFDLEPSK